MAIVDIEFLDIIQNGNVTNTWVDLQNIIDGTNNTFATCTAIASDDILNPNNQTKTIHVSNTGSISRTDYISKVEFCIKGYKSDEFDCESHIIVYKDSVYFEEDFLLTSSSIEHKFDITDKMLITGTGFWEWSDIEDLRGQFDWFIVDSANFYIDSIKIIVTTQDEPIKKYGLKCYNENGDTTLDITDGLSSVAYSGIFEANSTPVDVDIIVPPYCRFGVFSNTLESNKIAHYVELMPLYGEPMYETRTFTFRIRPQYITIGSHTLQSGRSSVVIMRY